MVECKFQTGEIVFAIHLDAIDLTNELDSSQITSLRVSISLLILVPGMKRST